MKGDALNHLLTSCPFLKIHLDGDILDLSTVVYGGAAGLLIDGALSQNEADQVFDAFNLVAEEGTPSDLDVLATGAIEMFNDTAAAQQLARKRLTGPALDILEEMRVGWGQPDYGACA